jgi:hypothetical protein
MSRISVPTVDNAPEASKPTLEAIRKSLGVVPNLFRLMAKSPAVLNAYAGFKPAFQRRWTPRRASASRWRWHR